ncbi:hypothetical protein ACFVIM_11390 [Streptomyces sp. NPDC057638]|uniref:hypothetical protein n=1 Tax=Streptomyces sp. NPDC057638 TaxID=3346190 RepID=UPI0036BCF3FE
MAVDATGPEAPDANAGDRYTGSTPPERNAESFEENFAADPYPNTADSDDDAAADSANGLGEEVPEADAAEQHTEVSQRTDDPPPRAENTSANVADALEQTRVVALDEDDYR